MHQTQLNARLAISGVLECRDADGNVIKLIELNGTLPLEEVQQQEQENGADDSE